MVARSKTVVGAITTKHISPQLPTLLRGRVKSLSCPGRLYIAYGMHTLTDKMGTNRRRRRVYDDHPRCARSCFSLNHPDHPPRTVARPYVLRRAWRQYKRSNNPCLLLPFYPVWSLARTCCTAHLLRPIGPVDYHFRTPLKHKNQQVNLYNPEHML